MSLLKALRARLRALFLRRRADRELAEEIRFHLEQETEKNLRAGMTPDDARRVALAHFGGVQRVREEHRDVRRLQWLEDAAADARFALRSLRRTPALAGAAVATLALGIGANVAIFSAVNAVVLQPLPFPHSDRLVTITEENPEKHWHLQYAAAANLLDWRAGVSDFQDVAGYFDGLGRAVLTGRGEPQVLTVTFVMGNVFSTLGVSPVLGRTFRFDESFVATDSAPRTALLSDRAWRDRFGADPGIVGKSVVLDGDRVQIVGVMPPGFSYPRAGTDAWLVLRWSAKERASIGFRRAHGMRVVARLKPGATMAHANAQLQSVVDRLKREYPGTNQYMGALMMPLHDYLIGDTRLPLLLLLTSVAFLLLIACANVGNLLLVQAAGREREMSLRLALGAARARLVRQSLTESLVLSVVGGAAGTALGWIGTRAFVRLQPANMLRVHDFGVDAGVVVYAIAVTVLSGLLFGVAPALWSRRRDPAETLKDGGRGTAQGVRAKRWGEALVVVEVALALSMTVGAGLLVRSFLRLRQVDPGFDPHGVFVATVSLNNSYNSDARIRSFMTELESRVRALPGATGAGMAMNVPFTGTSYTSDFIAYGRPANDYGTEIGNAIVSPDYFSAMKVKLVRGRTFDASDGPAGEPAVVINQALADSYFKGEDPVGQRLTFDKVPTAASTWYRIIGVVGNEHIDGLDAAARTMAYHSSVQDPSSYMYLVVRTAADPLAIAPSVRGVLRDLDPRLALMEPTTLTALEQASLARMRFLMLLLVTFSVVGVVLAVVGVYGVLAHITRNRTREMGIRLALGAPPASVRRLVASHGIRLALAGLVLGGAFALLATRAMAKLLFGIAPTDPLTYAVGAALLVLTSSAASWIPARRASRADPIAALRAD